MSNWNTMPRFKIDFSSSDLVYALNNLHNNNLKEMCKTKISNLYGINRKNIFFTNTGRTALYIILKALNLKKNARIGVQLFCCPIVFESIIQAGYQPLFLEIQSDTFTLDIHHLRKHRKEIDALIVVHTFGNPADMDSIQNIMEDKPIIEDCAHAIYSKYKNNFVGTLGDAAFFSYGPGKNISAGGGGALIINNSIKFKKSINTLLNNLDKPSIKDDIKFIFINYLKAIFYRRPWYGIFTYDVAKKFDEQLDLQNNVSFKVKQITKSNIAIIYIRYNSILDGIITQQKNIESLKNKIIKLNVKTISHSPNTQPLFFLYPIVFSNSKTRNYMFDKFKKLGIDALKFYSETPEIAKKKYKYDGKCSRSENIITNLLVLPTYYDLRQYSPIW